MKTSLGHRNHPWIASFLTLAILTAAGAGILTLRHRADGRREGQVVLGKIEAAVGWQTVETMTILGVGLTTGDDPRPTLDLHLGSSRRKIAELRTVFVQQASRLESLGFKDARTQRLMGQLEQLQIELQVALDLVAARNHDNAYIYGLHRIKPAYERIEKELATTTAAFGKKAERAHRLGDTGAVLTLAAAMGLLFILRRRLESQRRCFQDQLQHEALHDPLTDLPNRRLLTDRVENACARGARGHGAALMFIDLDGFKQVNDSMGHDAGDAVLRGVAERLSACLRATDTVSRIGGDEFAVLVSDVTYPVEVMGLADRILDDLNAPFAVSGGVATIGASVGIAVLGEVAESAQELCNRADAAMYIAKRAGKGAYRIAPPAMGPSSEPVSSEPVSSLSLVAV